MLSNYTNGEKKFYLGVSETSFKERFRNHKKEFTKRSIGIALNCQNIYGN